MELIWMIRFVVRLPHWSDISTMYQSFERKSAMFALACARLLIVNLLEDQVGLYNGGNMGLLKIVFEEHLSMYGKLDRRQVERFSVLSARCNPVNLQGISSAENPIPDPTSQRPYPTC